MKKMFFLIAVLAPVWSGCSPNLDATGTITAYLTTTGSTNVGKWVHFAVVDSGTSPEYVSNWRAAGKFQLTDDGADASGNGTACVPDADGNATALPAAFREGIVIDIRFFIDNNTNFAPPSVTGPDSGDEAGNRSWTVVAGFNYVVFSESGLQAVP